MQATKAYGGQDVQLHLLSLALEGCQLHAQAALPPRMLSALPIEYEAGWISELSSSEEPQFPFDQSTFHRVTQQIMMVSV